MGLIQKFENARRNEGLGHALTITLRWATRKLGLPFDVQPYDYIQTYTEHNLHRYLGCRREDVRRIVTVGAHLGHEVKNMLGRYPQADFKLFEASPRYVRGLRARFGSNPRVQIFDCAVSDTNGELTFYETNLAGSGSLLKVGDLAAKSYGMEQTEAFKVQARRLDDHAAENRYADVAIDCLWVDVQGAEMGVLRSAGTLLDRVKSVFIEVSVFKPLYEGGATMADISSLLTSRGFVVAGVGTDPANGTGNALFVRPAAVAAGLPPA